MTKEELEILYKERILPENKNPYHFEEKIGSQTELLAYNPICGDKFKLYLEGNSKIDECYFHGVGCAISKASTSIMAKFIEGKSKAEVSEICESFIASIEGKSGSKDTENIDLKILTELKYFDGRMDCVTLSWKALSKYLETEK